LVRQPDQPAAEVRDSWVDGHTDRHLVRQPDHDREAQARPAPVRTCTQFVA
jgi:hypothetical protein